MTVETIDGGISFAVDGRTFFASNSLKAVEDMIGLAHGGSTDTAATSAATSEAFSSVFANSSKTDVITAAIRPAFVPFWHIPQKADNPLGSLLLSGWLDALRESNLFAVRMHKDGGALRLEVRSTRSKPLSDDVRNTFFATDAGAIERDEVRRLGAHGAVGLVHLRRDLGKWWQLRDDLMEEGAAAGLHEANSFLSTFFGGMSFQDEVLPKVSKGITLVSQRLSYDDLKQQPRPQIPGFAVVFRVDDADELNVTSAFYQLITVINLERGKDRKEPFVLGSESAGAVSMAVAKFSSPKKGKKPLIEHNFSPSVAIVDSRVILGSNKELTRRLVEELGKSSKTSSKIVNRDSAEVDLVRLRAKEIQELVRANRAFLADTMVLNDGISSEEADG